MLLNCYLFGIFLRTYLLSSESILVRQQYKMSLEAAFCLYCKEKSELRKRQIKCPKEQIIKEDLGVLREGMVLIEDRSPCLCCL